MDNEIKLMDAIAQMRADTNNHRPFSIEFISYSRTKSTTPQRKVIESCLVRSGYTKEQNSMAGILLNLYDVEHKANRQCYIPTIIRYNNLKVKA
ncbi:MAG: hypothetical protein LAT81_15045 [Oceanicaulis sp.]|nr:hypothetical protein [Oceanicaulis sp.]